MRSIRAFTALLLTAGLACAADVSVRQQVRPMGAFNIEETQYFTSRKVVIENPSVQKIMMKGQESWQITGESHDEALGVSEEDIKLVMEKTGTSKEKAKKALEDVCGEVAEAIVKLSG